MKYKAVCPPEWLSRSAVYQINPRTFSADGTIRAVTNELPKLKELGFRVMYLCPIFEEDDSENRDFWSTRQKKSETNNPKNPYRMNNYFKIDSEYGTEDDLREFIEEAHRLGMRVLLDLVYLHIGPNAPILKRHPEFARQDRDGNIICTEWNFPYLDYTSDGLREYLMCNMIYYLGEMDADGFRCDVGDGVPTDFWVEARRRMKAVKPDSVLINEGSNWNNLLKGFDSSYCFDWHVNLYKAFSGEISAAECRSFLERLANEIPSGAKLIFDIDNHDTVTDWPKRTEKVAGHNGMEQIEVINYLLDGIPMVYCGNELADEAYHSLFANRFHMGRFETTDRRGLETLDYSLRRQEIMKGLNTLKLESDILCYGSTVWVDNSAPEKLLSFSREYNGKKITFIGNISREKAASEFNAEFGGRVLFSNGAEKISDGTIELEPRGYVVLEK
ncbi:MAG TPA: hypothetical protein DCP17_06305 [Ruminococcaceae bacterium]|nr:hypothetical protein [Oscillospiraceae bacterium]